MWLNLLQAELSLPGSGVTWAPVPPLLPVSVGTEMFHKFDTEKALWKQAFQLIKKAPNPLDSGICQKSRFFSELLQTNILVAFHCCLQMELYKKPGEVNIFFILAPLPIQFEPTEGFY